MVTTILLQSYSFAMLHCRVHLNTCLHNPTQSYYNPSHFAHALAILRQSCHNPTTILIFFRSMIYLPRFEGPGRQREPPQSYYNLSIFQFHQSGRFQQSYYNPSVLPDLLCVLVMMGEILGISIQGLHGSTHNSSILPRLGLPILVSSYNPAWSSNLKCAQGLSTHSGNPHLSNMCLAVAYMSLIVFCH